MWTDSMIKLHMARYISIQTVGETRSNINYDAREAVWVILVSSEVFTT